MIEIEMRQREKAKVSEGAKGTSMWRGVEGWGQVCAQYTLHNNKNCPYGNQFHVQPIFINKLLGHSFVQPFKNVKTFLYASVIPNKQQI